MATPSPLPDSSQRVQPSQPHLLRWLAVIAAVLVGGLLLMRFVVPSPVAPVYEPPPVAPKTVAQVEAQIKSVQNNKNIPESQKGRILGFLQGDLQKAQAAPRPSPAK